MEHWVTVDRRSKYVTIGIIRDNELVSIDINLIENDHYWGVVVLDENHKYIETSKLNKEIISFDCVLFGIALTIRVYLFDNTYDVCIKE